MAQINERFATREDWLTEFKGVALEGIVMPAAETLGHTVTPSVRVSVGFGKYTRGGKRSSTIAKCFPKAASTDGVNEVFVDPECDDPVLVAAKLIEQLVHAVDDCESGSRRGTFFSRCCERIGLEGNADQKTPNLDLGLQIVEIIEALGPYPHARMEFERVHVKQATRQLKVHCEFCQFVARTSALHVDRWVNAGGCCPVCSSQLTFHKLAVE